MKKDSAPLPDELIEMIKLTKRDFDLTKLGERPWSLKELAIQFFNDSATAQKTIRGLPGHKALDVVYSLEKTYELLTSYTEDVARQLEMFEKCEMDSSWYQTGTEVDRIGFEISKGFFAASCAASSLRDLQRRAARKFNLEDEYDKKRQEVFDQTNLAEFIYGLRNYSLHRSIITADWEISSDFEKGTTEKKFLLRKDKLLEYTKWTAKPKAFIHSNEKVDVKQLLNDLCKLVEPFNIWLIQLIRIKEQAEIEEYAEYEKILYCVSVSSSIAAFRALYRKDKSSILTNEDLDEICKPSNAYDKGVVLRDLAENKYGLDLIDLIFKTAM